MTAGSQVASLFGIVDIQNLASPVLETVKGDLTSLGKSMGSTLKSIGSHVTEAGAIMTGIGAPFAAFAAKAIQSAGESQLAVAQLDAVLKSTGGSAGVTRDQLIEMSEALQRTTMYSDEATLGAESMLLTFTGIGSTVFPRALRATTDLATAMKVDLKSASVMLGKSLNAPLEGLTALTRVGVTFTQGQKDAIQAMVDMGDVAGAQSIILDELSREFGGSAEAAGQTFPGALAILQNRFDGILETIGANLIPIIQQATGWIGDLITWFENLDPGTQQLISGFIAAGAALAVIGPIVAAIGIGISALGSIIAVIFSPIGIVIGLVVGALLWLADHFGITLGQLQVYGNLIKLYAEYYFQGVVTAIQNVWTLVQPELQKLYDWFITEGLPAINTALSDFQTNFITPVSKALSDIWKDVSPALSDLGKWFVSEGLPGMGNSLTNFKVNAIDPVVRLLQSLWNLVSPTLTKFGEWFSGDTGGLAKGHSKLMDFIHVLEWLSTAIQRFMDLQAKLLGFAVNAQAAVLEQGNPGGATHAQGMAESFTQSGMDNGYYSQITGGSRGFGGGKTGTELHFHAPITVQANNWKEFEDEFINRSQGRG